MVCPNKVETVTAVAVVLVVFLSSALAQSDLVKHDLSTQNGCTEVTFKRPTRNCMWHAGLYRYVDQILLQGQIIAYKIQWFNGRWSGWYVPGVNDIDGKVNLRRPSGCTQVIKYNTMRRWWSYFYDHNHRYIICNRTPANLIG